MDHPLAAPDLARPWRTATIVASAVAALELLALLAVGTVLIARPVSERVQEAAADKVFAPARPAPRAEKAGAPKLARAETSVLVLNGNGTPGAAAERAADVKRLGYLIGGVGNAPRLDYTRSLVMYRAGYQPEAERLARDLKLKIVGPLDGLKKADLMGAHVAVVVGS